MNKSLPILISGLSLGVCYFLMGMTSRTTWAIVYGLLFVVANINGVGFRALFEMPIGIKQSGVLFLWKVFIGFIGLLLLRSWFEYRSVPEYASDPVFYYDIVLKNFAFVAMLALVCIYSRRIDSIGAVWIIVIGIGVNASLNLIADRWMVFSAGVFGESRFEGLDARWLPPVIRSNAFFAMSCTVAVALTLFAIRNNIIQLLRQPIVGVAVGVAFFAALVAALKCQFRAHLIAIGVCVLLSTLKSRLSLAAVGYGVLSAVVVFPSLFAFEVGHELLDFVAPERALTAIGSSSTGASDLSERTLLYSYGLKNLSDSRVFLFGEGPVLRDAQNALDRPIGESGYRMPYHSAFVDFLMQWGALIGTAVVLGIGFLLFVGLRRLKFSVVGGEDYNRLLLAVGNLVFWLSLSIMDSGLSNFETLCMAVVPLFGALSWCRPRNVRVVGGIRDLRDPLNVGTRRVVSEGLHP